MLLVVVQVSTDGSDVQDSVFIEERHKHSKYRQSCDAART